MLAGAYRVFPTPFTVIGFQFSGRIHYADENRSLSSFGVTGILDSFRSFRSDASTRSLLIYFKPGGFYRLFGPVVYELRNESLALSEVLPSVIGREFAALLNGPLTPETKWGLLQERFIKRLHRDLSPETSGALYHLEKTQGGQRIETIAKDLGTTRRTLERRFFAEVGVSPKHLARIFRWNHVMKNLDRYTDLGTAAAAHGYFDQAHFIRETREFGGITPARFAG